MSDMRIPSWSDCPSVQRRLRAPTKQESRRRWTTRPTRSWACGMLLGTIATLSCGFLAWLLFVAATIARDRAPVQTFGKAIGFFFVLFCILTLALAVKTVRTVVQWMLTHKHRRAAAALAQEPVEEIELRVLEAWAVETPFPTNEGGPPARVPVACLLRIGPDHFTMLFDHPRAAAKSTERVGLSPNLLSQITLVLDPRVPWYLNMRMTGTPVPIKGTLPEVGVVSGLGNVSRPLTWDDLPARLHAELGRPQQG